MVAPFEGCCLPEPTGPGPPEPPLLFQVPSTTNGTASDNRELRYQIEDVLLGISDGRLPSMAVETELDWALTVSETSQRKRFNG